VRDEVVGRGRLRRATTSSTIAIIAARARRAARFHGVGQPHGGRTGRCSRRKTWVLSSGNVQPITASAASASPPKSTRLTIRSVTWLISARTSSGPSAARQRATSEAASSIMTPA
jgi:hypothetical protein